MSEKEKIELRIRQIKAQMVDATRRLQGREYVHWKQVTAKRRLLKDLNEQLKVLEAQYKALEDDGSDE